MKTELPPFKLLLTGASGALVEINLSDQRFVAAVSEDDPPTRAFILFTPLKFPNRIKARLSEDLKKLNIQVIRRIEIPPDTMAAIYARYSTQSASTTINDVDYERYRDDVRALISRAVSDGASDIHIVRRRSGAFVSFRAAGQLSHHADWSEDQADQVCRFIYEVLGHDQSVTWNRHQPQDAVLDTTLPNGRRVRVRIGTIPTSPDGYDMVLRILPDSSDTMRLDDMGYEPPQMRMIHTLARRASGLVVIAGSVGSGKSTSIVGMLNEELDQHQNLLRIITVEDPPERVIAGASQVPVVRKRGVAEGDEFSFAIRGALRCDPDTLMVGEIRDKQSAILTIKFAQTGHRVYTTVHASTALGVIERITGIGVEPATLCTPDILRGLIYQALVPVLCENCKIEPQQYTSDTDQSARRQALYERTINALDTRGLTTGSIAFRGAGCSRCNRNGITGRTVIAEIAIPDDDMLEHLRSGNHTAAKRHWITKLNGQPVAEHAIQLVAAGRISPWDAEWQTGSLEPARSPSQPNVAWLKTTQPESTHA